jgi:hypothetical protein
VLRLWKSDDLDARKVWGHRGHGGDANEQDEEEVFVGGAWRRHVVRRRCVFPSPARPRGDLTPVIIELLSNGSAVSIMTLEVQTFKL